MKPTLLKTFSDIYDPTGRPLLMGVLNMTPDSFSDGGQYQELERATRMAEEMSAGGAAIIDIGGESTAPGSAGVQVEEEQRRILEVVSVLSEQHFLSIDTFRSQTAAASLERGARMINDVSALRFDPEMTAVIRAYDCYVCLMYSKEADDHPHATKEARQYDDCVGTIIEFLKKRISVCLDAGIAERQIVIDPGMGAFVSSDPQYSWQVLRELPRLKEAFPNIPLLIGTSRKGFLGGDLSQRDPVSQLSAIAAFQSGADIIRTHNISMASDFFRVWQLLQPVA